MTQKRKSETTRQAILDCGRSLVTRGGFAAMGLSALLKESGVPKGSFYHYFPSKEAFGQTMLADYVAEYLARIDDILAREDSGAAKLEAFCAPWLSHGSGTGLVNSCLVVNLGAEVADLSEDMRQTLDDGVKALVGRLADMMRQGVADGSLRLDGSPETAALALYSQLLGAAILSKLSQDQAPLETVLDETRKRLMTGA